MSEHLTHLKELEAESIYILREVAAQFERPCILFSGGKDSIVLTYLAYKAFYPAKIPFPLVHIDIYRWRYYFCHGFISLQCRGHRVFLYRAALP